MQQATDDMVAHSKALSPKTYDINGNRIALTSNPFSTQQTLRTAKTETIASKLKLSQASISVATNFSPVATTSTVKTSPKNEWQKPDPKSEYANLQEIQTRSLMVDLIPRKLSLKTVEKYFMKFGKILQVTDPPRNSKSPNTKFIFIKFENYETVDKVIGNY